MGKPYQTRFRQANQRQQYVCAAYCAHGNTEQRSTAQHGTAHYNAAQRSTAQNGTAQVCKQQGHAALCRILTLQQDLPLQQSTGSVRETEDSRSYLHIKTHFAASFLNNASNIVDTELLCELVVDSHLPSVGWVVDSQLYAPHLQQHPSTLRYLSWGIMIIHSPSLILCGGSNFQCQCC